MHREPKHGLGPFEAFSRKPNGFILRTRHWTEERAEKRLSGNRRHRDKRVIDYRPRDSHGNLLA